MFAISRLFILRTEALFFHRRAFSSSAQMMTRLTLSYATDANFDAFLARLPHIHSVPADLPHGMRDIDTAVFWAQSPAANDWEAPFVRPDVIQRANHMPVMR
jgi:hypothetical protein